MSEDQEAVEEGPALPPGFQLDTEISLKTGTEIVAELLCKRLESETLPPAQAPPAKKRQFGPSFGSQAFHTSGHIPPSSEAQEEEDIQLGPRIATLEEAERIRVEEERQQVEQWKKGTMDSEDDSYPKQATDDGSLNNRREDWMTSAPTDRLNFVAAGVNPAKNRPQFGRSEAVSIDQSWVQSPHDRLLNSKDRLDAENDNDKELERIASKKEKKRIAKERYLASSALVGPSKADEQSPSSASRVSGDPTLLELHQKKQLAEANRGNEKGERERWTWDREKEFSIGGSAKGKEFLSRIQTEGKLSSRFSSSQQ